MPYVDQFTKANLQHSQLIMSGGLNYLLTMVVIRYLKSRGLSYQTCNDIVGALDNCKDEFRRRVQHPLEDKKIIENGDCYPPEVLKGGQQ